MKGIVLYDFLLVRGGAERLTLDLVRGMPGVDLCVGYRDPSAFGAHELDGIRCHDLHAATAIPGWRTFKVMRAFAGTKTRFLEGYDWALYSGSNAPLAVHQRRNGRNLYYCHALPRFVYDLRDYYLQRLPPPLRPALKALAAYVKPRYEASLAGMDTLIANSENVRGRVQRYIGRDALVVNPPIDVERFRWSHDGGYFLSLARLEDFKRVDLIVEAFRRLPQHRLVVASGGSQATALRKLADGAPNISFTSWLGDDELGKLIAGARAAIYIPHDEDFGMSPVESMAAGKPVIGVAEGGLLETVVDGETGLLLPRSPTVEDLVEAVLKMTPDLARSMRGAAENRSQLFSKERFLQRMREVIGGS